VTPLLTAAGIDRLRGSLTAAGFTRDAIVERYGQRAVTAYDRGDPRALVHAVGDHREPLSTLIRLLLCGLDEPVSRVAATLPLTDLLAAGMIVLVDDRCRAAVWLHPYRDWWVVADLPGHLRDGPPDGDHVVGVGASPGVLVDATVRVPVDTALDLGTGCGVQALHLSEHAAKVTATDLSARALRFAATTAALNGLDWELLSGDLAAPVAGRRFDLVVANLPYIVGPGGSYATHHYRDSGRPGDAVGAELAAGNLLTDGGYGQFLASWVHVAGEDWTERVSEWVAGTGCDAWILQHRVTDPARYVAQWLGETGDHHDLARRTAWLDYFHQHRVDAVGFGLVTLRRTGLAPVVTVADRAPVTGGDVRAWFETQDWLRDNDVLAATYRTADDVRLSQEAIRDHGWQLDRQLLTHAGRTVEVDPFIAALVGRCDDSAPLTDHIAALAVELTEDILPAVRKLVAQGILVPLA
jgi:methylase of polypeptide subunit release factors